jgi:hypothetical protein
MQTPPLKLIPEGGGSQNNNPTDRNFIEGFHQELEPREPDTQRRTLSVLSSSSYITANRTPKQHSTPEHPSLEITFEEE